MRDVAIAREDTVPSAADPTVRVFPGGKGVAGAASDKFLDGRSERLFIYGAACDRSRRRRQQLRLRLSAGGLGRVLCEENPGKQKRR